jgi:hypothetical protein
MVHHPKLLTSLNDFPPNLYEPRVRQQLQQWGMSAAGVQQISTGQMPTDARDRLIVASLVAHAAKT